MIAFKPWVFEMELPVHNKIQMPAVFWIGNLISLQKEIYSIIKQKDFKTKLYKHNTIGDFVTEDH